MQFRPFKFPDDYQKLIDLFPLFYQYPGHPDWSLRPDEIENQQDFTKAVLRFSPLIRLAMPFSATVRDAFCGAVCEDEGKIVAAMNFSRQGTSDTWWVWNIGILPEYQHKALAGQLMTVAFEIGQKQGARIVLADIITQNAPARRLAVGYGMKRFTTQVELLYSCPDVPGVPTLPDGYEIRPRDWYDWRPLFDLAKRITPEAVTTYLPVDEARFRQPSFTRPLRAILQRVMGLRYTGFVVVHHGLVVAAASYSVRTKAGGFNEIEVHLDPSRAHLAPYLVSAMTAKAKGRPIRFVVQSWLPDLIDAALAVGFVRLREWSKLGIILEAAPKHQQPA